MPRAYLDTTFYDSVDKGRFPADELDQFKALIARQRIQCYFSLTNADELVGQWNSDRPAVVRKFQIAERLVGFDHLLKAPADLLRDEITAYAQGIGSPGKMQSRSKATVLRGYLRLLARNEHDAEQVVPEVVALVKAMKDDFLTDATDARDQVLRHMKWEERTAEERSSVPFEDFYADGSLYWAEVLADGAGFGKACRGRGIVGLLERRPVRLCVGAIMSWIYSMTVPHGGGPQTRQADRGADFDRWHAILASAADVFLTNDGRFLTDLSRLKIDGFRVVRSLRELLDEVDLARSR